MHEEKDREVAKAVDKIDHVSMRMVVDDEYKYIRPLAYIDFTKEDSHLLSIKQSIVDYINEKKREGVINAASAYLRDLNQHQDVRINPSEVYLPGSLMKIPIMVAYLKASEKNPGILNKQIVFSNSYSNLPVQNITGKSIQLGITYTVNELLQYMIVYSDNNATALLNENIDFDAIVEVFEHLQLPRPDPNKPEYGISLKEYSRFFRVLFGSSYLGWDKSEYALGLLAKTEYRNGLLKYIDPSIPIAHKFGERNIDGEQQFHEVGIVYLKDRPYLIGVMTKGSNIPQLEEVVSQISKIAYEGMTRKN